MKKTYIREDMIDLNGKNVKKILDECVARNDPEESNPLKCSFIKSPKEQLIYFSRKRLEMNRGKIEYMYGQLFYTFASQNTPGPLTVPMGSLKYTKEQWTKDKNYLFAFYYLGVATSIIHKFSESGESSFVNPAEMIPTVSPNDPRFDKLSKMILVDVQRAAEEGIAKAQFHLGVLYIKGNGVPMDYEKSAFWLEKAAEQGHAEAQVLLAAGYVHGDGVSKDMEKAIYWVKKAAEQGQKLAQHDLGMFYANGEGVPKDMEKAMYWIKKAAEQGEERSIQLLKQLS